LWRRFPVHPRAQVWYVDRCIPEDLKRQYAGVKEGIFKPDVVADATELPVAEGSLDFLIASHVLEHLPFPLQALKAWYRALSPQGVLIIKVPDKRFTFDSRRRRTALAQLKAEYESPELFDWRAHYVDWVENVDGRKANGVRTRARRRGLGGRRPEYSFQCLDG